jgi:hypothetical protein
LLRAIEAGLLQGIVEMIHTKERAEWVYRLRGEFVLKGAKRKRSAQEKLEIGRQSFLDYTKAEWSVMFATDKLILYKMGFISAKDGDLRKAVLLPSWRRTLNLCKWKVIRENPSQLASIILHAIKIGDGKFLRRLGDAVAKPAQAFDPKPKTPHDKLQAFLLHGWINEPPDAKGKPSPAFAYFDHERLYDCLQGLWDVARERKGNTEYLDALGSIADARSLRAIWERLGLIKANPLFRSVEVDRSRRNLAPTGKLTVSN